MKQDLFDWLNSQTISRDKGLLIAPLAEILPSQNENDDSESNRQHKTETPETESAANFQEVPNEDGDSESNLPKYDDTPEIEVPETLPEGNFYSTDNASDGSESPRASAPSPDDEERKTHEWQERATGFTLSLDEPPPELWTRINDDDPDPEYEPTDSLQGAAYVQIHGRNFTERLHHTLRTRKERMQSGSDDDDSDGVIKHMIGLSVILCSVLIMALGLSCIGLYFVWRMTFYRPEGKRAVIRNADTHIESVQPEKEKPVITTQSKDIPRAQNITRRIIPREKPKTFTDYLNEGNYAYNIGMYNRAVINFWRAKNINGRDIRPYLGLSACYRKKGMYTDAHYVIEEARRLFGRSPAVDMAVYFLREAQKQ